MRILAAFVVGSALLSAAPALAAIVHFTARLDGASETPPNDSKGMGDAKVALNTTTRKIIWVVTYSGLTGPATAAHFHGPAPAAKSAPVAVPMVPPLASPIRGSATISDVQVGNLRGGLWYVNVHTAAHPAGEIRGQLAEVR